MSAGIPTPPVLTILVDALLPAESPADGGPRYPSASELGVDRDVAELVATLPSAERAEFATLLRALDGRVANLLLGGRPVRFSRLSSEARAAYLRGWSESRLAIKRRGFHALKRLAAGLYYAPRAGVTSHPLWPRIGYEPPAPADGSDPFGGLGPIVPEGDVEERVDVAVVGSGAGGSVVAARLTAAGHRVALLEAGAWVLRLEYPRYERAAHEQLFVGRGVVTNSTHSIGLLAGEAVGGGTAINWMTCLPPRPEARAEWARAGMTGIDGPEFDRAYAAVAARLEVSTAESEVNASNDALRRGCRALGYLQGVDWDLIPRNAVGCRARCGSAPSDVPTGPGVPRSRRSFRKRWAGGYGSILRPGSSGWRSSTVGPWGWSAPRLRAPGPGASTSAPGRSSSPRARCKPPRCCCARA
jgi:long-chain-alcohol oxidase